LVVLSFPLSLAVPFPFFMFIAFSALPQIMSLSFFRSSGFGGLPGKRPLEPQTALGFNVWLLPIPQCLFFAPPIRTFSRQDFVPGLRQLRFHFPFPPGPPRTAGDCLRRSFIFCAFFTLPPRLPRFFPPPPTPPPPRRFDKWGGFIFSFSPPRLFFLSIYLWLCPQRYFSPFNGTHLTLPA